MEYKLTKHVRDRMLQRRIEESDIKEVLERPVRWQNDPNQNSVRLERVTAKGELRVWVVAPWPKKYDDIITVKSAAWKE